MTIVFRNIGSTQDICYVRKLYRTSLLTVLGVDEDDPVNSDYNMKLTKFSFQIDRYRNLLFRFAIIRVCVCVCEA